MCYLFYNTSWSAVIKCMCVWLATCLEETPPQFRSQLEVLLYMWKKLLGRVFLVGPSVKCMLSVLIHHYVRTSDGFWWCYESSIHDPAVHVLRMCGLECEVLSAVKKPVYQGHREKASERRYLEIWSFAGPLGRLQILMMGLSSPRRWWFKAWYAEKLAFILQFNYLGTFVFLKVENCHSILAME